jgi:uncharacterized protein YbjQ (UPF0145 family)
VLRGGIWHAQVTTDKKGPDGKARVCEETRNEAYTRMMEHACKLGAHGVIEMRFDAIVCGRDVTEVLAYGTAVLIEVKPPQ